MKNVLQIYPGKPLFAKFDGREQVYGSVVVSNKMVRVFAPEQMSLPLEQLTMGSGSFAPWTSRFPLIASLRG